MEKPIVYTREYFLDSTEPYETIYNLADDPFVHLQELERMATVAKSVGVNNFKALYQGYLKSQKLAAGDIISENISNFDGQTLQLNTGRWVADDKGVSTLGSRYEEIIACMHPLMITRRLVNIDTGVEKLELAWRRGSYKWRTMICDRRLAMSSRSIIELADNGIGVTSENAKYIVQYLHDIESLNYDTIPEVQSVSRLGWVDDDRFAPYVKGLEFDGDTNFKHFFESVKERGDYNKWVEAVKRIRADGNISVRILLAASFASVLVEPCNCLPFFVHLWGGTEAGKTVALMLAASVWANPEMGKYIHTFNSTAVAQELSATFVNSLPLLLDELQIVKERKDFDQMIYQLSEGVGRSRGHKTGGLQKQNTWNNCIITTGEQPISNSSSGGGAINRIIEISCEDTKLFKDPVGIVEIIRHNHGHAGRRFVEALLTDPSLMQVAKDTQKAMYKKLAETKVTEKQALAASLILTADSLIDAIIFNDGNGLEVKEVAQFLSTHEEVSANERAFSWLTGWVAQNFSHFTENDNVDPWGKIENSTVYIINSIFGTACNENGFNPDALKRWLRRQGRLDIPEGSKGFRKPTWINGVTVSCIAINGIVEAEEVSTPF